MRMKPRIHFCVHVLFFILITSLVATNNKCYCCIFGLAYQFRENDAGRFNHHQNYQLTKRRRQIATSHTISNDHRRKSIIQNHYKNVRIQHDWLLGASAGEQDIHSLVTNYDINNIDDPNNDITINIGDTNSTTTVPLSRTNGDINNAVIPVVGVSSSSYFLSEMNVLYGIRTSLVYDVNQDVFVSTRKRSSSIRRDDDKENNSHLLSGGWKRNILYELIFHKIIPRLRVSFLPSGVTQNYYPFMRWRIIQRFVNANLHVFGTQSLLLGLGIKAQMNSRLGALSAALNWVLKDALGKIVRMVWASKMGLRFDGDAKRWRFRSAFVFAAGNGLEIATYIFPNMFLVWATLANCCKQISTLTSSSTRSSIFNSFRDGTRENIADITAKGEAQIAIVELLGIASGISLSRYVGMSVRNILMVYFILQALEIFCVYSQLRHVEYRVLNFERLANVVNKFITNTSNQQEQQERLATKATTIARNNAKNMDQFVPSPHDVAIHERMFLPPEHISRRRVMFGSLGRSKLSPHELDQLLQVCSKERYILVVGSNVKYPHSPLHKLIFWNRQPSISIQENCHIVLHSQANNNDIVKSTLALLYLRHKLSTACMDGTLNDAETIRSSDCMDMIEESVTEADQSFGQLLRQMSKQGWESPARLMFARVNMRAEWPLQPPVTSTANGTS